MNVIKNLFNQPLFEGGQFIVFVFEEISGNNFTNDVIDLSICRCVLKTSREHRVSSMLLPAGGASYIICLASDSQHEGSLFHFSDVSRFVDYTISASGSFVTLV